MKSLLVDAVVDVVPDEVKSAVRGQCSRELGWIHPRTGKGSECGSLCRVMDQTAATVVPKTVTGILTRKQCLLHLGI